MKNLNHGNIDSKNPPYPHLIFNNVDGYIEERNGDKFLAFVSIDKNKELLKKYLG